MVYDAYSSRKKRYFLSQYKADVIFCCVQKVAAAFFLQEMFPWTLPGCSSNKFNKCAMNTKNVGGISLQAKHPQSFHYFKIHSTLIIRHSTQINRINPTSLTPAFVFKIRSCFSVIFTTNYIVFISKNVKAGRAKPHYKRTARSRLIHFTIQDRWIFRNKRQYNNARVSSSNKASSSSLWRRLKYHVSGLVAAKNFSATVKDRTTQVLQGQGKMSAQRVEEMV